MSCKENNFIPLKKTGKRVLAAGFTLIEVIVALVIFSVISLALGGVFFSGLRLWQRFSGLELSGNLIPLEMEAFARNLRRAVNYAQIDFSGTSGRMEYAAVLRGELKGLIYNFDAAEKSLFLTQTVYPDSGAQNAEESSRRLILSADTVDFSYLIFDTETGTYVWKDKTQPGTLPLAAKIYIRKKDEEWKRTVFLPLRL